jgi:hypothetical protein
MPAAFRWSILLLGSSWDPQPTPSGVFFLYLLLGSGCASRAAARYAFSQAAHHLQT